MKGTLVIAFILITLLAEAQNCDCNFPYRPNPPCYDTCIRRLTLNASFSTLVKDFKLPDTIARKMQIWGIGNDTTPLKLVLNNAELGRLNQALRINKVKVDEIVQ